MGVVCQILVDPVVNKVHKAGEFVTGVVKYTIDETTEFKDISLSFIGTGSSSWSDTDASYSNSEQYFNTCIKLHVVENNTDKITLRNGAYEYRYKFQLPENIPSSFHNPKGRIIYQIVLKFETVKILGIFHRPTIFSTEIPVKAYVTSTLPTGPVVFGLRKTLITHLGAIHLKAEIEKCLIKPGENIQIKVTVDNQTDVTIKGIRTAVIEKTTYTSTGGFKQTDNPEVLNCSVETEPIPANDVKIMVCVVPTILDLYSIQNAKVIAREYFVRVTVKLPMPHRDDFVNMPIVIGDINETNEAISELKKDLENFV